MSYLPPNHNHAEVKIIDSVIMLGQSTDEFQPFANILHLYTEEVDQTFTRALQNGAKVDREPQLLAHGQYRGSVIGPEGNHWAIAKQV